MTVSSIATGYDGISLLAGNAAYDPAGTWLIQRVAGTGSSNTITFSSIPQTYKHLQLRGVSRDTQAVSYLLNIDLTFNSNTSNYAWHRLEANGSTVGASGGSSESRVYLPTASIGNSSTSGIVAVSITDIHDYTSSTKNKTVRSINGADVNASGGYITLSSGLWANTSAITSITLTAGGTNFGTTTSFALYGMVG